MLPPFRYVKATSVNHAVELAGEPGAAILAGGTDMIVDLRERRRQPALLVDISEVPELSAVRVQPDEVSIGACASVAAVAADSTVRSEFPALVQAIGQFADYLTRNKATLGGNVANASPGADLVVPLLALEATVVLATGEETRTLALDDFILGPRETALRPGELVCEVVVPRGAPSGQSYQKLGLKHGGAIAVVSTAVAIDVVDGRARRARVALGAVAPRPFRSTAAERSLEGAVAGEAAARRAAELAAESARPISDVRGSAEYRRAMVMSLVERSIGAALVSGQ